MLVRSCACVRLSVSALGQTRAYACVFVGEVFLYVIRTFPIYGCVHSCLCGHCVMLLYKVFNNGCVGVFNYD